jgi:hypothetical protein
MQQRIVAQAARTLVAISSITVASALSAQRTPVQVQFGVEGGLAFASNVGADADGSSGRTTGFAGVTMILHRLRSPIAFQTGLQLIGKGARIDDFGTTAALRLRYVEAPLLLRFVPFTRASGLTMAFTAGVSVAVRVGCSVSANGEGVNLSIDCNDEIVEDFIAIRRLDTGLSIGADVAIPAGTRLLIAPMVRYTRGLLKVSDEGENDRVYNNAIQLGVGVRLRR